MNGNTTVSCPACGTSHVPVTSKGQKEGLYASHCQSCGHAFQFQAKLSPRNMVTFTVNGIKCQVSDQYEAGTTLNSYMRDVLHLTGTKVMCREGGCGVCVVTASFFDQALRKNKTVAINSCLCPVYGCDGWEITTTEGIGDKKKGYHAIQSALADHNGSQCGYCSPGMVMNMYSLLAENPKPTAAQVEAAFDGQICRCTGFRSILDAMKSFCAGGSNTAVDIEELGKGLCGKSSSSCQKGKCATPCEKPETPSGVVRISLRDAVWIQPETLAEVYKVLAEMGDKTYKLVVGNTSSGVFKEDGPYDCLVNMREIPELCQTSVSDPVTIGSCVSLSITIQLLEQASSSTPGYGYLQVLVDHLKKVAGTPVRNAACWAGNLMVKHRHREFPSDVFLCLETVGAKLSVGSGNGKPETCSPSEFLQMDMRGKVILSVTFQPMGGQDMVQTYKVMPRYENAYAYVNAGFWMHLKKDGGQVLVDKKPSIVYGGINKDFIHATNTENFLLGKNMADEQVLQGALKTLQAEVRPSPDPVLTSPEYRNSVAVGLLYKFVLHTVGDIASPDLRSGGATLVRPLSSGKQSYDTDHSKWPLTQPTPKLNAKAQAAGEARYVNDMAPLPGELFGAFVVSSVGNAKIQAIDPAPALSMPGVVRYIDYKDIPEGGTNNSCMVEGYQAEELFCTGQVEYAGQALGMIIAASQEQADAAAKKVKVTYTNAQPPILDLRTAIAKESFFPGLGQPIVVGNAEDAISKAAKEITGEVAVGTQYHMTMETQSCVCVPSEEGMDVYPTSQWLDASQQTVAQVLGISNSNVYVQVRQLGGGYGGKISRNWPVSAGCALAAYVMNKPVRVMLSLQTNMEMLGKRLPYLAKYEIGVSAEGKLLGVKITYYADCGYSSNEFTADFAAMQGDNAYQCDNWHLIPVAVKTNTPSNTYCRSPATVPAIFIIENILEHVAKELQLNPVDVKRLNLYQKGQKGLNDQPLDYCNLTSLLASLESSATVEQRQKEVDTFNKANRWKKKGLAVVPLKYGVGWNFAYYGVFVSIHNGDGTVSVAHGGIEIGQGISTKIIQVCAYELGIPMSMVTVRPTDSVLGANSQTTGGSVTSELNVKGLLDCLQTLKDRLAPVKAQMDKPTWKELIKKAFSQGIDLAIHSWVFEKTKNTFQYMSYGVTCTEMELDVLTGENQISRVDILFDCGESMNPEVDIGQVEGAFVMGLGYYLMEKVKYHPQTGQNLTNGTWEYKPPTARDIPVDFRIQLLKDAPNPVGVLRSKACGEPPMCMTCSVLLALKHALYAARENTGDTEHFQLDAPATVEVAQKSCLIKVEQFKLKTT